MSELIQSVRRLLDAPWYFATATAVIALSMALATTVFAVVDDVLFKTLPYERPEELFEVSGGYSEEVLARPETRVRNRSGLGLSFRDATDLAAAVPEARLAAYTSPGTVAGGSLAEWSPIVAAVEQPFFDVLGIHPRFGQFGSDDFAQVEGSTTPVVITDRVWRVRFGGRQGISGQAVAIGDRQYRVVGVLPENFAYPANGPAPDFIAPLKVPPDVRADRRARQYTFIARLRAIEPIASYQERFNVVARAAARELGPGEARVDSDAVPTDVAALVPLQDRLGASARQRSWSLLAIGAGLVLLGCVNVSGMLTARLLGRRREFALRSALGGRRRDVAMMTISESAMVVIAGVASGVTIAAAGLPLVTRLLPDDIAAGETPSMDWRVLAVAALACTLCIALVSLWPTVRALKQLASSSLAHGGLTTTGGRSRERVIVIGLQVALGLLLTFAGTLVVGSFVKASGNPGFEPDGLIVVAGVLQEADQPINATPDERVALDLAARPSRAARVSSLLERARNIPGVVSAGATSGPILTGTFPGGAFGVGSYAISSGFIETMRPRLLAGRWPTDEELDAGADVAVLTPAAAARYFPGVSPIGERLTSQSVSLTVIGLAEPARYSAWDARAYGQQYYVPYRSASFGPRFTILIQAGASARDVLARLIRDPESGANGVQLSSAVLAEDVLADTIRRRRLESWVFGAFSISALIIVGSGILGLVGMLTSRRERELGIRAATGASRPALVRLILREQLGAVGGGLALGTMATVLSLFVLSRYAYGAEAIDLRFWATAVLAIVIMTLAGVLPPALRACRVDPVTVLKAE